MILRTVLLIPFCFFGQKIEYQKLFQRANLYVQSCDSLVKFCEKETTPIETAYHAAGLMLKSKHERKLKYFKIGRQKLEGIISKYPNFVELRWIRYCIQKHTPRILNYKQHTDIDRRLILKFGSDFQKIIINKYD
tara:strand:+ start:119 stop:523 length:405 start_codon:yes stop_codon:yes gene_type:complete